jgi:putative ribosome biogenesis GTPase RsgA
MSELPEFFFRVRENGAAVFRVDTENRQRRIEMTEIAVVNIKNGRVKPHGDHVLTGDETEAITEWMAEREALLARRDLDDIHRTIDHLNLTAQWAQSRADDDALEDVTDRLLMAMHDLRSVLVRKKADRLMKGNRG